MTAILHIERDKDWGNLVETPWAHHLPIWSRHHPTSKWMTLKFELSIADQLNRIMHDTMHYLLRCSSSPKDWCTVANVGLLPKYTQFKRLELKREYDIYMQEHLFYLCATDLNDIKWTVKQGVNVDIIEDIQK